LTLYHFGRAIGSKAAAILPNEGSTNGSASKFQQSATVGSYVMVCPREVDYPRRFANPLQD